MDSGWVRLHGGPVLAELTTQFGPQARTKMLAGEVVDAGDRVVGEVTVLSTGVSVYLYRDLSEEMFVPLEILALYRDADIVVAYKSHFLVTMPQRRHVAHTVLVRLNRELGLSELNPAYRLDQLAAGVLLFTTRRELCGRCQTLFSRDAVRKIYLEQVAVDPALVLPRLIQVRIVKRRGNLKAVCEPGLSNVEKLVKLISPDGLYRLTPRTGHTHPLLLCMASLGMRIVGDPLYSNICSFWRSASSSTIRSLGRVASLSAAEN